MGRSVAGMCLGGAISILPVSFLFVHSAFAQTQQEVAPVLGGLKLSVALSRTLGEAVNQAIAVHPDIRTATANWRAVSESVAQARAQFLPSLDATLGQGREKTDSPLTRSLGSPLTLTRREAQLNMSQLLFDGGASSSQLKREEARAASAYGQLASTAETVAFRTAQAFFEVLRLRSTIELAEQNLAAHQRTLEQIVLRSEAGVGRRSDDRQTEARVALARSSLVQLRCQLEQAEASYRNLTGQPPGRLVRSEISLAAIPASAQAAVDEALSNHPAVLAAKLDLEAAEADRELARSRYAPRVTFELGASQNHDLDGLRGLNADRSAMVMLRQNFFRGGADAAREREADARRDEAAGRLAKVQTDLERDVRQAWEGLASDRARLPDLQLYADTSAEVVEAYRGQFSIAQRSLLDVLNAENESYNARSGKITGEYTVATDLYRLLSSMGRMTAQLGAKLPEAPQ